MWALLLGCVELAYALLELCSHKVALVLHPTASVLVLTRAQAIRLSSGVCVNILMHVCSLHVIAAHGTCLIAAGAWLLCTALTAAGSVSHIHPQIISTQ
jgi:hypothetical protein